MNNQSIICTKCGETFPTSNELELRIKNCAKCIEKSQDEMLKIIFGEPNKSSSDEE